MRLNTKPRFKRYLKLAPIVAVFIIATGCETSNPARIDEANEITFAVDPALKARAEAELRETRSDLPLVINDYVASYINFFSTRGRGTFVRAWQRAGRYQGMIRQSLQGEGVP